MVGRYRCPTASPAPCSPDRVADEPLTCAECGREPREGENAEDEWRAYLADDEEMHTFCPECAEREFGEDA